MTRLYTADYSTGNFNQWSQMANKLQAFGGQDYPQNYPGGYPAAVISEDRDCGYVGRFEVRDGDSGITENDRSEVTTRDVVGYAGAGHAPAGSTRWYAFSVKFDTTFPANHGGSWCVTNQFHDDINGYSPTISWGFAAPGNSQFTDVGYWHLVWQQQEADHTYLNVLPILQLPILLGQWHDIKMQVKWSPDDTQGFVKVWYNGEAQTLRGGSTTFTGRTMVPGAAAIHYAEGIYRDAAVDTTFVVYHGAFRMADTEDGL